MSVKSKALENILKFLQTLPEEEGEAGEAALEVSDEDSEAAPKLKAKAELCEECGKEPCECEEPTVEVSDSEEQE